MRLVIGRWIVGPLFLILAAAVGIATAQQTHAQVPAAWQALGPTEAMIVRLYTPSTGALLARTKDGELYRSDDGGLTWLTVTQPQGTSEIAVSNLNQQRLYAAGAEGIYRSEDGGQHWEQTSVQGGNWTWLALSPADQRILYGVAVTSPPTTNGKNRWTEFRVSHDSGVTWETIRTHHETIYAGTQPCFYGVRLVQPHGVNPDRVLTIEGCSGRAMEPVGSSTTDGWNTVAEFPGGSVAGWGANAIDGGRGVRPERWYAVARFPGEAYTRVIRSRLVRSDDDGATWTTMYEADGGDPDHKLGKTTDSVIDVAYDPANPDDVFAAFAHLEPSATPYRQHNLTGLAVRRSRDGAVTWTELGAENLPVDKWIHLTLGMDGRHLYAATTRGVYRLALTP
ncbi:MAG: hypothetical protein U0821_27810 [Chloroflexota bacterium]